MDSGFSFSVPERFETGVKLLENEFVHLTSVVPLNSITQ